MPNKRVKMEWAAYCLLHTFLLLLPCSTAVPCPRPCSCPQPTELHCTFRSLTTVPGAVPKHMKRINLGFNSLSKINEKSFLGLTKLELLMIHGNEIHFLPDGVFSDLASLQMLKMSYNKLKEINGLTLQGLRSLTRLHLDHNHLEFIHPDSFQGLLSLRLLLLEGNRLRQLHPATFATFTLMGHFHISTLRHLSLSDNGVTSLPSQLLKTMPLLENLFLDGNPWACDCSMSWFRQWEKSSGVLKCKKDKADASGRLCPICASPKHLKGKELDAAEKLVCRSPVISFPHKTRLMDDDGDAESKTLTTEDFKEPIGNVSLDFSDEHGNKVDLECGVVEPKEFTNVKWDQIDQQKFITNISFVVDLECPVDREKYEQLWRLIAYYSAVPAHLKRGAQLSKQPDLAYVYKQDSELDAQYYTGLKVKIMARPSWLMQSFVDLQLNRPLSTARMVKLMLKTNISQTVTTDQEQRQRRPWVMIESTNTTRKVVSSILGSSTEMHCNVQSFGQPVIQWVLPDSSKLNAGNSSPDEKMSVSRDGRLIIKSVTHRNAGIYHCVARVQGDFAVLPLYLTVQESSSPPPGEETATEPLEYMLGKPFSLDCIASGSPDAEINWILPNSKITSFKANSSNNLVYSNGTLHIPQLKLSDTGYYKCIATNQHGVDTTVKKIVVVRGKGLIRPLRKFFNRPQSASGINTQIKLLNDDVDEASGESEINHNDKSMNGLDSPRRRIPAGVAPGRRGTHPSSNKWRKAPVLRKPIGSHIDNSKSQAENRRRINLSKSKITPEKWADIWAKIRERKTQNLVTSPPVLFTKRMKVEDLKKTSLQSHKESSHNTDSQDRERHDTVQKSEPHSFKTITEPSTQSYTNLDSYAASETHSTNSQHTTSFFVTTKPESFSFPQTTPVSSRATTLSQDVKNTVSTRRSTFPPHNSHGNVSDNEREKKVKSKGLQRKKLRNKTRSFIRSRNHTKNTITESQILTDKKEEHFQNISSVTPFQAHNAKTTPSSLQSEGHHATASPKTDSLTTTKNTVSEKQAMFQLHQTNSRRKNGGRRKKLNRRKQKQNNPTTFTVQGTVDTTTPVVMNYSYTNVKTERNRVTVSLSATVPFTERQVVSLDRPDSKVSSHQNKAGEEPYPQPTFALETSSHQLLPKMLFFTTSSPQSFSTVSPILVTGHVAPYSKPVISESLTSSGSPHILRSTLQQGAEILWKENGEDLSSIPSPSSSTATFIKHVTSKIFGEFSNETSAPRKYFEHYFEGETKQVTTQIPAISSNAHHGPGKKEITKIQSNGDHFIRQTTHFDGTVANITAGVTPSPYSAIFPGVTRSKQFLAKSEMSSLLGFTTQSTRIKQNKSPDTERNLATTTTEPDTSNFYPTILPSEHGLVGTIPTPSDINLNNGNDVKQISTPISISPFVPTKPSRGMLLTVAGERSRDHRLPESGSVPNGRPRITKSGFQTVTVKAETDAHLPCEVESQPVPFLSWTQVSTGASIARNMRLQRFEVDQNGTLIIRNSRPLDGGQFLCTVQNQFGTDNRMFNLVVLSQRARILQPRHRDFSVHLGSGVELECRVEGFPTPRLTWVLPSHVKMTAGTVTTLYQQRVTIKNNGSLRISQATFTDRGLYKCFVSNEAGSDTVSVHLNVLAMPPFIKEAQYENVTILEASSAYINCTATGIPKPVIQWTIPDGSQLSTFQPNSRQNIVVFPNGTLYIQRLGHGDSGKYKCIATNTIASTHRTVMLTLKRNLLSTKATIMSSSPEKTEVKYGHKLVLNCVATGEPKPRIIWRTPSKKLVDNQFSFDPRIKVFHNGSMIVHSVTEKDGGYYLCLARNKMGDDYIQLQVIVLSRPARIEQKQQWSRQEVTNGEDLKVDCVASGLPNPEISWALPDGTMLNPDKQTEGMSTSRSRRYVVFDNGTLYFNDVGMPEEGDYTCYAENLLGKDEMKVRVKVKVEASPPIIQDKDKSTVRVFFGETVTLHCDAKGEPFPVITWISPKKRQISPASNKYHILNDGTLIVQKVQLSDGGNYTCTARNKAGQDHKFTRVEVLVSPLVMNGLRGTSNTVNVTTLQGQETLVDCMRTGISSSHIVWILPGNEILPTPYHSSRWTVYHNGTLHIHSPRTRDTGQLACVALDKEVEVKLLVNFMVEETFEKPETSISKTKIISLRLGDTMTLNCSMEEFKLTHLTWILPSGTPLHAGARLSKFFHQSDGSLVIANPTTAETGMYRCLGHNSAGLVERRISLSLGRKPVMINRYPSTVSIMNGEALFLHCETTDEPLRLTWTLPSGVILNRLQRVGRYEILPNGTLLIRQVSIYDRGLYVCGAANEYGTSLLSVSVIIIGQPPRITSGPPSVTFAKHGVAVQLNCVVTGMPKVEIAWETPDKTRLVVSAQPRLFGNKYLHPQGSLIIQNPTQRDAGVYRCTAKNDVGADSKATFLNIFR